MVLMDSYTMLPFPPVGSKGDLNNYHPFLYITTCVRQFFGQSI